MTARGWIRSAGGAPIVIVTGIVALGLKLHYRTASAEDLGWILGPTAAMVGRLRGEPLLLEREMGWMPADHSFIIAPVCAGVNFLIALFVATALGFAGRFPHLCRRCAWLAAMLGAAYVATIAVNALRITVAVALYDGGWHAGWLTAERVHRLAGIGIYLAALMIAWRACDRVSAARVRDGTAGRWMALPLLAYAGVTVLAPLANGAWGRFGAQYVEHALTVASLTGLLLLSCRRSATERR